MSEMIERVARALARSEGGTLLTGSQSKATREFGWDPSHSYVEKYVEAHWKEHVNAAHFAIEAMREPTEAMIEAGVTADTGNTLGYRVFSAYRAMLDAALSTPLASEGTK